MVFPGVWSTKGYTRFVLIVANMATMPMVVREVHPPERMWAAPCRMIGMNKMDPALSNRVPMAHG